MATWLAMTYVVQRIVINISAYNYVQQHPRSRCTSTRFSCCLISCWMSFRSLHWNWHVRWIILTQEASSDKTTGWCLSCLLFCTDISIIVFSETARTRDDTNIHVGDSFEWWPGSWNHHDGAVLQVQFCWLSAVQYGWRALALGRMKLLLGVTHLQEVYCTQIDYCCNCWRVYWKSTQALQAVTVTVTVSTHQETFSLCINWRRERTGRDSQLVVGK
jgi:hypothetical protein